MKSHRDYPKVPHAADMAIHHLRRLALTPEEYMASKEFVRRLNTAMESAILTGKSPQPGQVLILGEDGKTVWKVEQRREQLLPMAQALHFE